MYKVYMVDDEQLALNTYEKEVPWIENNFELIGTNTNPISAVEEIITLSPHVVFTDIKMPFMSGNQLIEKIKERISDIEFIIISSYDDFPFVRKSLQLSVFDYLLKPVSKEVFEGVFDKLNDKLNLKHPNEHEQTQSISPVPDHFQIIIDYIKKKFRSKISLSDVSEKFSISKNTLCSYFNKYYGTTFVSYLVDLRMEYAKNLLCHTNNAINDISRMCGYDDYFYFCHVFRRYFSCTPSKMRQDFIDSLNDFRVDGPVRKKGNT